MPCTQWDFVVVRVLSNPRNATCSSGALLQSATVTCSEIVYDQRRFCINVLSNYTSFRCSIHIPFCIFTALHGMQRGLNDEISVRLSVRPSVRPSVCLSNACIVTKRKKDMFRFLYHTKEHLS